MELIASIACIAGGAAVARIARISRQAERAATLFLALSVLVIGMQLTPMLLNIPSSKVPPELRAALAWLTYAWHAAFGLALALAIANAKARPLALAALSVYVAGKYFVFTIGKLRHEEEMVAFFVGSGLPAWMHYFILCAEVAGACGLLLHRMLRTGPAATAGLAIIMLGAVGTHWHNGDPFSDSYDAVKQLIYLAGLMLLSYWVSSAEVASSNTSRRGS